MVGFWRITPALGGAGDSGNTTGTWLIEENELCMVFKYPGRGWDNEIQGNCYSVRHDRSGFGFYSSVGRFLGLTFKHNRFPTKGKLLTAVLNLSDGGTKADAGAPDKALLAEIDRLKLEAEEARQALEARKVKEVKEAEIRKKKAEKEKLQIAELKRKKDEQARLAAKATTDKKRQGGKQSLRERVAALKDLKDAGLLSEEEFQANKVAVLNEYPACADRAEHRSVSSLRSSNYVADGTLKMIFGYLKKYRRTKLAEFGIALNVRFRG